MTPFAKAPQLSTELSHRISKDTNESLVRQLNWLIARDLLVVHTQSPVLVRHTDSHEVTLQQAVELRVKDHEYIEELESKVQALKDQLLTFTRGRQ